MDVSIWLRTVWMLAVLPVASDPKSHTEVGWDSAAQRIRVRFGGTPAASLSIGQRWFLREDSRETLLEGLEIQSVRKISGSEIGWVEQSRSGDVRLEYSLRAGDAVACSVRVVQNRAKPVGLRWQQEISGFPRGGVLFAPSGRGLYPLAERDVTVAYRDGGESLSIPMAAWLDEKADLGLTVAARLAMPVPGFQLQTDGRHGAATVTRRIANLEPGRMLAVEHYYVRHAGDWRPGLGWVRGKFPQFFMLPDPGLIRTHGCFTYSHEADEKLCDQWVREGLRNLEIHFTYSHLGKYFPDEEPWIKAIDDKWSVVKRTTDPAAPREDAPYEEIKRYMSKVVESRGGFESVRRFIQRLKARGISTYIYFQPTESWEFFANTHYKDSILRRADGGPATTWYDHVQMDCRPETAWGQYLCRQLGQVLDALPEVDGVFMDQSAGDRDDYSVCRITDRLARIAEARGKLVYWNGPYQVELAEHAVGMLAEAGAVQGELIKYLTIGNKICCGMGASERQYQRNLVNGLWPSAPSLIHEQRFRYDDDPATFVELPEELANVHRRYMHLYELYPGKVWYLGAHAVEAPEGVQTNIFQRPNGDYLIPIIAPDRTLRSAPRDLPTRVTVRVPDAARVRGVYARTPETPGQQFVADWSLRQGVLQITVPWLGSACLLWISKQEQPSAPAPPPPRPDPNAPQAASAPVMSAGIRCEGVVPTGAALRVKTTAPLPPVPTRKCVFNGRPVGGLSSRNSRWWHTGVGIGLPADILSLLREENELVIEPAGPEDFFKIRNLVMTITLADGRTIVGERVRETYSSCAGPQAEGVIGSPIRINIRMPQWKEVSAARPAAKP